jgi:hypothetical protein
MPTAAAEPDMVMNPFEKRTWCTKAAALQGQLLDVSQPAMQTSEGEPRMHHQVQSPQSHAALSRMQAASRPSSTVYSPRYQSRSILAVRDKGISALKAQ